MAFLIALNKLKLNSNFSPTKIASNITKWIIIQKVYWIDTLSISSITTGVKCSNIFISLFPP